MLGVFSTHQDIVTLVDERCGEGKDAAARIYVRPFQLFEQLLGHETMHRRTSQTQRQNMRPTGSRVCFLQWQVIRQ